MSEESLPWLQLGEEKLAEVVRQSRRRSVAVSHHVIQIVIYIYIMTFYIHCRWGLLGGISKLIFNGRYKLSEIVLFT